MKNTQTEVVTTQNGFRLAMSVDGALTGRGGDIIIIDDPIAALAALSQKAREHVQHWYFNTLLHGSMTSKRRHRDRDAAAARG